MIRARLQLDGATRDRGPRAARRLALVALGLAIGLTLPIACSRSSQRADSGPVTADSDTSAPSPRRGGTVTIAIPSDLVQVNELLAGAAQPNLDILRRVLFLSLFEEQPDWSEHAPTFRPSLAESISWSEDRKLATVRLRAGALWSDGTEITAEDVVWTHTAQTHPDVAWDYSFVKESILEVTALDRHTVTFRFATPTLTQMADLNEGAILPRHVWSALPFAEWRERPDWFREYLVTNGPFTLQTWTRQQELVFARNERFAATDASNGEDLPRLDRIVMRVLPDRAGQRVQVLAGDIDYAEFVPPAEFERFEASRVARVVGCPTRQVNFIAWNTRRAPFDDARVRLALTHAIDRQALVDVLYRGHARVAVTAILEDVWARDRSLTPWPHDPAEARRLFAGAGYEDRDGDGFLDRDGKPLRFDLWTNAETSLRTDAIELVREQLRRVGVDAVTRSLEIGTLLAETGAGRFDAMLLGTALDTTLDLWSSFHSRAITEGSNWSGYSNPEVDRLLEEFQQVPDEAAARPLLNRLQAILHRDQPSTWLWEPDRFDAVNRRLRGLEPNALSPFFGIERWWVAAPGQTSSE